MHSLKAGFPVVCTFCAAAVSFESEGAQTSYTAQVRHWTEKACDEYREMGFYEGWNMPLDQLIKVARTL